MAVSAHLKAIPEPSLKSHKGAYSHPKIKVATSTAWLTVRDLVEDVSESGLPRSVEVTWRGDDGWKRTRVRAGMAWADEHLGTHYLAMLKVSVQGQRITVKPKPNPYRDWLTWRRPHRAPHPPPPEMIGALGNHLSNRRGLIKFGACEHCGASHWVPVWVENWAAMSG